MEPIALLIAALAVVAGLALGWYLGRTRAAADLARAEAELAAVREDRDRQHDLYRDAVRALSPGRRPRPPTAPGRRARC